MKISRALAALGAQSFVIAVLVAPLLTFGAVTSLSPLRLLFAAVFYIGTGVVSYAVFYCIYRAPKWAIVCSALGTVLISSVWATLVAQRIVLIVVPSIFGAPGAFIANLFASSSPAEEQLT